MNEREVFWEDNCGTYENVLNYLWCKVIKEKGKNCFG